MPSKLECICCKLHSQSWCKSLLGKAGLKLDFTFVQVQGAAADAVEAVGEAGVKLVQSRCKVYARPAGRGAAVEDVGKTGVKLV